MTDSTAIKKTIINFVGFQIGWFACVLGGANAMPWLGPLLAIPILAWHFSQARDWTRELRLIAIIAIAGSLFDQFLLWLDWIQYPSSNWPGWLLPVWMPTLWVMFSSTLNVSLRWMRGKYWIGLVFGMIGGPLAYIAGQKLGAMELASQTNALIVLAVGWAMMMPAMLWLSSIFDGYVNAASNKGELSHV
ncbi:MAG: DUF2878 domain-containing protein [Nitrosomonadales bacterium]|nr:DUF2878 domain-containing protein [Nitrosomonadales bacterium]